MKGGNEERGNEERGNEERRKLGMKEGMNGGKD